MFPDQVFTFAPRFLVFFTSFESSTAIGSQWCQISYHHFFQVLTLNSFFLTAKKHFFSSQYFILLDLFATT